MAFDLETYISRYTGYTRLKRLLHIMKHGDDDLKYEAFMQLCRETIESNESLNSEVYKKAYAMAQSMPGLKHKLPPFNHSWCENVEKRTREHSLRLLKALNDAQRRQVRERIRSYKLAHTDIGDFYTNTGDLGEALKSYSRTRDYNNNSDHLLQMCLNVIRASIDNDSMNHVQTYVPKGLQALDGKSPDRIISAKLDAAAAISSLHMKEFHSVAEKLVQIPSILGDKYTDVISCEDVAVYGSFCALASFDRRKIKDFIISNSSFKSMLELVPRVREMLHGFYNADYATTLRYMSELKRELQLDIHLSPYIDVICERIRQSCLMQYVSPYSSVNMVRMAKAFDCDVRELEKELATLIRSSKVAARIDSRSGILYANHTDQRLETYNNALEMGNRFCSEAVAAILRINLLREGIVYSPHHLEPESEAVKSLFKGVVVKEKESIKREA